jgi:hypothetical protein
MEINYVAVGVATVVQFIVGAVWYMFLFGKTWGRMHGFDQLSKEVQQSMMKKMPPFYALQFGLTFLTSYVLALFIDAFPPSWNIYGEAGFFWLGFVVPTQVSAVVFGGTEGKWVWQKISIMAFGSLACLMAAAAVFSFLG